jgi:hypothetical protein
VVCGVSLLSIRLILIVGSCLVATSLDTYFRAVG